MVIIFGQAEVPVEKVLARCDLDFASAGELITTRDIMTIRSLTIKDSNSSDVVIFAEDRNAKRFEKNKSEVQRLCEIRGISFIDAST